MDKQFFPQDKIFSVTEINSFIKEILEGTFPQIVMEGEISNFKPNSSGHLYFRLKDSSSQISAVMFRNSAYYLNFAPKDGMKVRCTGKITVYLPNGNYQIVITKMEIAGEGDILKMLEERKRRLHAEGLFDPEKKKPLPLFPEKIGVVTSPTGAAIRDILQIARRRNPHVSVIVLPALVQGETAAPSIVKQIKTANEFKMCDVLIVGRGGGSIEDLLPFSEEEVVRAIAESEIPVVSAVGHEIDIALSDYAADRRAPTPSAAAEIVIPQSQDILKTLFLNKNSLYENIRSRIERMKLMVKQFSPEGMELKFRTIEQPLLNRLDYAKEALHQNMELKIREVRRKIENCTSMLESSSPESILARGYSMVKIKGKNQILRNSKDIKNGEEIEIFPAKGKITATVTKTE